MCRCDIILGKTLLLLCVQYYYGNRYSERHTPGTHPILYKVQVHVDIEYWVDASLAEELDVAGLAVGVVAVLLEGALVEQFEAEGAGEVLRVPLLAHGCDALASHWLLAAGTQRAPGV